MDDGSNNTFSIIKIFDVTRVQRINFHMQIEEAELKEAFKFISSGWSARHIHLISYTQLNNNRLFCLAHHHHQHNYRTSRSFLSLCLPRRRAFGALALRVRPTGRNQTATECLRVRLPAPAIQCHRQRVECGVDCRVPHLRMNQIFSFINWRGGNVPLCNGPQLIAPQNYQFKGAEILGFLA